MAKKKSKKKVIKLGRFRVAPESAPGIYRPGVGMFRPGYELTLPDRASKPGQFLDTNLIPLNVEAVRQLKDSERRRVAAAKKLKESPPVYDPTIPQEIKEIPEEDDPDVIVIDDDDDDEAEAESVSDDELEALTRPGNTPCGRAADQE